VSAPTALRCSEGSANILSLHEVDNEPDNISRRRVYRLERSDNVAKRLDGLCAQISANNIALGVHRVLAPDEDPAAPSFYSYDLAERWVGVQANWVVMDDLHL
jgi:hypothetical protein